MPRLQTSATGRAGGSTGGPLACVLQARMERLRRVAVSPRSVLNMVEPELHDLVREFAETTSEARRNGTVVESIAVAAPDDSAGSIGQPGCKMPIHAATSVQPTPGGKACATPDGIASDPSARSHGKRQQRPIMTENTIIGREATGLAERRPGATQTPRPANGEPYDA